MYTLYFLFLLNFLRSPLFFFFFFNDTATTEIYTLSLHDALPILLFILPWAVPSIPTILSVRFMLNPEWGVINTTIFRSEEHTSELQSQSNLVCRLLLEKKKKTKNH